MLSDVAKSACGKAVIASDPEMQDLLNKLDREGVLTPGGVAKDNSKKMTFSDMAFEAYVNSMLSSPTTHSINIISNTAPVLSRAFETLASATTSSLRRMMPGASDAEIISFREAYHEVAGIAEGMKEAVRYIAMRASKDISSSEEALTAMNLPTELITQAKIERAKRAMKGENLNTDSKVLKKGLDWLGNVWNVPGQFLTGGDAFFKVINYRAEISKLAARRAFNQTDTDFTTAFNKAKTAALNQKDKSLTDAAIKDADFRTYTNQPEGQLNSWMAGKGGSGTPYLRWLVPFRRTVVNLMSYGINRSPLGLTQSSTWKALKAGGAEFDDAVGRMTAGTMILGTLGYTLGDRLDGAGPKNMLENDLWQKDGHEPYTLRFDNGKNMRLDNLGPFGFMLKAWANYQELASNIDYEADDDADATLMDMAETMTFAMGDAMLNDHWMSNVINGMDALSRSERDGNSMPLQMFAAQMASGFIPNIVKRDVMRSNALTQDLFGFQGTDPNLKDMSSPMALFQSKIPFWASKISNKIDLWGNPMTYEHFADPSLTSTITGTDMVSEEMRRVRVVVNKPRRSMQVGEVAVKMTPQEYEQFNIYAGKGVFGQPPLRDAIAGAMQSPYYRGKNTSDFRRRKYIEAYITKYREAARFALAKDDNFDFGKRVEQQAKMEAHR